MERLNFYHNRGDIYEAHRASQRLDLSRRNDDDISGIYRCTVETKAVHNDSGREMVYAGLYASGGECTHVYMIPSILFRSRMTTCAQTVVQDHRTMSER